MIELLVVAVGGGVGAAARFMVDGWIRTRTTGGFPWGTFVVNVVGSFLIGVFATVALTLQRWGMSQEAAHLVQLALVAGLCGGFTTFSTATVESVRLARSGRLRIALVSSLGTLLSTVLAAMLGMALGVVLGTALV